MFQKRYLLFLMFFPLLALGGREIFAQNIPQEWRQNMELKHEYRHFRLNLDRYAEQFFSSKIQDANEQAGFFGQQEYFCREQQAETLHSANPSETKVSWDIDLQALETFLREDIAPQIENEPSDVVISRNAEGKIVFEGYADFGEELDVETSALLIAAAAKAGVNKVTLAVKKTDPMIEVTDPELQEQGIREILAIGYSNFSGSPVNRRHNIAVGASRFNGVLIPQGETFSFNRQLGRVDGSTGYRKELVIVGPQTIPEYGGGLCQVSSTTYRGAMLAGLPIVERINHSYNVRYYYPIGSDATIYPGSADLRFTNDTPGAILLQTRIEGDNLFYIYYGIRDHRHVYTLGPYEFNYRSPLPTIYTTSTNLAPGETELLSEAHSGLDAVWYRLVEKMNSSEDDSSRTAALEVALDTKGDTPENQEQPKWETYFSRYKSTARWIVTGVEKVSTDGSWIQD